VICSSSRHVIVTANKGIAYIARCREIALWRQGDTASAEKSVHLRLVGTDQFDLGVVLLRPSHLYQSLVPHEAAAGRALVIGKIAVVDDLFSALLGDSAD